MVRKKRTADKQKNSRLQLNELMTNGIDAYIAKDYETSFYCFSQAVVLGDTNAAWLIGRSFYYGQGCNQSYRKAAKYYKKASTKRVKEAMYGLSTCYHYGLGVHRSKKDAIKYLILSADQGYSLAQNFLARKFLAGDDVERDEVKACHYFSIAADQGCVDSQYFMYVMYKMGYVPQDIAIKNLKLAAESGHAKAQRCLGKLHYYGDMGFQKDKTLAFVWCERAAQQNDGEAAYCVALNYMNGEVVEKDEKKAIYWLRVGASHNYSPAQLDLARALLREKTENAYKEAIKWLNRGAALGNSECKYGLGLLTKMREQGISWFEHI